jgi:type I restriction enzyme S subunit
MAVEKGYKQTEIGVIPVDWEAVKIESIIKSAQLGGNYSNDEVENEFPLIKMGNLSRGKIKLDKIQYISKGKPNETDLLKFGDVLFNTRNTLDLVGKVAIWRGELSSAYFNSNIMRFNFNDNISSSLWVNLILNTPNFITQLRGIAIGTTSVAAIYNRDLFKLKIPLPPLPEQTAIATALSDMDALIAQTEKLIEKKKAIKQGVMQELLRPKEGWVTKKLGEVCDIIKGQLITDSTRINGDIPVIAGGKTPAYYHNWANRIGKTITISGSGASAGYVSFHNYPIFASDCSTISESENYQVEFLFLWLKLNQNKIYKMQTGGAQPHIHPSDLNPMEINIPSIEQQKEIASILFDLEKEIEAFETRLKKLKCQKQGMMQALLTGIIRLV